MADLSNVFKVSKTQYDTLVNGGTVSGYGYDSNAIYLVDEPGEGYSLLKSMTNISANGTTTINNLALRILIIYGLARNFYRIE